MTAYRSNGSDQNRPDHSYPDSPGYPDPARPVSSHPGPPPGQQPHPGPRPAARPGGGNLYGAQPAGGGNVYGGPPAGGNVYGGNVNGDNVHGGQALGGGNVYGAQPAGGGAYGGRTGAPPQSQASPQSGVPALSESGSGDRGRRGATAAPTGPAGGAGKRPPDGGKAPGGGKGAKPAKRRGPVWAKLLIGFGALVMLASVGSIVAVRAGIDAIAGSVNQGHLLDPSGGAPAPIVHGSTISGPLNILMVGVDASGVRTDSIIIAHIPASHDRLYLISLPRDTKVTIPQGGTNKINSTFNSGFANLANTIKLNYGIRFNAGLTVNFDGFKDIITKLGGVDLYVDETTHSIHHGYVNNDRSQHAQPYHINPNTGVPICYDHRYTFDSNADKCTLPGVEEVTYPKGMYHFNAYDALDFVRCRDGLKGTDYARQRHQQQFLKAMMKKAYAQGFANPTKLAGLIKSLGKAFTFDRFGIALTDWLFTLKSLTPDSVITIKTNRGDFVPAPGPPDGHGSEQGLNQTSIDLLNAVRDDTGKTDTVGTFVALHSDWVANS